MKKIIFLLSIFLAFATGNTIAQVNGKWIGAITKKDAKLPDGSFSNAEFKSKKFHEAWDGVDSLSSRSILLRKEFKLKGRQIKHAMVKVSGMGHYELHINGRKVSDDMFAPLWSEYSKTIYYNVYDVTTMIRKGKNALCALLGNGFFNVQKNGRYSKLQTSFGAPQMILQLDIEYADGKKQTITTDESWKYQLSPITFNSIYGGESFDARLVENGCDMPNFNDKGWRKVVLAEGAAGKLTEQTAPAVKIMERYGVKSIHKIPLDSIAAASNATKRTVSPTAFVADMGQNLAGFPEITVSGKRGDKITLIVSETLTPQGACDQRQTGRQHYYEYTLAGNGMETWHPRFSYYGFRYIQVEGAVMKSQENPDGLPVIHSLMSDFVYNSAPEVSSFSCSNDLFTKIHRLIERAERSNMQGVLTDCPQREKLGWLEQDHLVGPSLLMNYDLRTYIPKIIKDITDTQKPDGMVPTIAPQYVSFGNIFDDSPEWGSTLVVLPFMYYQYYGDDSLIKNNYEPMRRYVDYLSSRAKDNIVSHGLGDWYDYGPWRAGFAHNTPTPLVATSHYIFDLQLLVKAAKITRNNSDAEKYGALLKNVTKSFNDTFYKADSCYYGTGSQTSNALPLYLGIVEKKNEQRVLNSLIADIKNHDYRLTVGDVGNRYLIQALARFGRNDIVYKMFNHYDAPGYGFQLKQGATTLTEQWDPRNGASWNHFMLGQIDEWLFRSLAGINNKPGTVGLQHLVIAPYLPKDMEWVKASLRNAYGTISVDIHNSFATIELPANTDATVILPNGKQFSIGAGKHNLE